MRDFLMTEIRYALGQLRKFRCIDRAIDALERMEARLMECDEAGEVIRSEKFPEPEDFPEMSPEDLADLYRDESYSEPMESFTASQRAHSDEIPF